MAGPAVGQIVDGYRFNGGDPNNQASWEPVGGGAAPAEDWGPNARVLPNGAVIAIGPRGGIKELRAPTMMPGANPESSLFQPSGAVRNLNADERKELATFRGSARDAGSQMRDMERFMSLNREAGTGAPLAVPILGDILVGLDPRLQEMRAITERLTPLQREAGSGAMSDRDVEMYRRSVPNLGQSGQANQNVAAIANAGAQRTREYSAFMEQYAKDNGNLVGAQEMWAEYTSEHPLFQSDASGNVRLRTGVPTWRQYFDQRRGIERTSAAPGYQTGSNTRPRGSLRPAARPPAPAQPQARQGAQRPAQGQQRRFQSSDFTPAQRQSVSRIEGGPRGAVGSQTNPHMVRTAAQLGRLPRGAWFIDGDGVLDRKQ